jgi:oligopeptide transport system substrate-binding protein
VSQKITRRQLIRGAGALAAGSVAAACAAPTPTVVKETVVVEKQVEKPVVQTQVVEKTVEKTVEVQVTAAPAAGPTNTLGVTLPADALPLDQQYMLLPVGIVGGGFGHIMESLYNRAFEHAGGYETLTSLNIDLETVPIGAESWKVSEDGLSWDFPLRKDLVFSDGKPVTANDWVYTLRRSLSNAYDFGWFYFDIKNAAKVYNKELPPEELGVTAVDDFTLRITTEAPTPYLPGIGTWYGVAPQHAYEQYGENWALDPAKYISSGPFILTQFERGVQHKWDLVPTYKGVRRPYVIEIREQKLPTGLAAYIAGDVQTFTIDQNTPSGEVAQVNSNPILRAESHPQPASNTDYIGFNTLGKFPELTNPDVRMALSKALDKETLAAQVFQGFGNPAWGILPKGFPNYIGDQLKELDPNKYDPEAAKALLAKAGFPDGMGFPKLEMYVRQPSDKQKLMSEAIQAMWKEVLGIEIDLRPSDFQSFTAAAFTDKTAPIYYVNYSLDYYDPATFLNVFRDGGRHPTDTKAWTEAYNAANATLDPAKRFELMQQSEKDLVNSTAFIFIVSPFSIALWPCNAQGETLVPNKDGYAFWGGGGVGCPHAYEGIYWSNSDCRKGL